MMQMPPLPQVINSMDRRQHPSPPTTPTLLLFYRVFTLCKMCVFTLAKMLVFTLSVYLQLWSDVLFTVKLS